MLRLSALALLAGLGFGQAPEAVLPSKMHDFGTVRQGNKLVHVFRIQNTGRLPLSIFRVDLTLPGMVARFKGHIPAGEEGTITVQWDTSRVNGPIEGDATLSLNDPKQPQIALRLKAVVQPGIELVPYAAVFFSVFRDETPERSVQIVNHEDRPVSIRSVEAPSEHYRVELDAVQPGKT